MHQHPLEVNMELRFILVPASLVSVHVRARTQQEVKGTVSALKVPLSRAASSSWKQKICSSRTPPGAGRRVRTERMKAGKLLHSAPDLRLGRRRGTATLSSCVKVLAQPEPRPDGAGEELERSGPEPGEPGWGRTHNDRLKTQSAAWPPLSLKDLYH